jgi:hypothetical protein
VSSFNPTNLNLSSWVASFEALGATSAVLTAKHGCGFLGWQTNTTLPDGSPYRFKVPAHLNVIEQFVAATEAAGIGHGFYYSLTNNFYLNVAGHNARPASTVRLLPGVGACVWGGGGGAGGRQEDGGGGGYFCLPGRLHAW